MDVHRDVAHALARSRSLREAAVPILGALGTGLGFQAAAIFRVDPDQQMRCLGTWTAPECELPEFERQARELSFRRGAGLPGRVWETAEPEWSPDLQPGDLASDLQARCGIRSALGFPIVSASGVLGVVELLGTEEEDPDPNLCALTVPLGWQLGERIERERAEERARLREEHLAHSEALLSEAEQAAASGSFERDLQSGAGEFSAGVHALLAAPPELRLTTECLLERVHAEDRELIARVFATAERDREPFAFEVRANRFDDVCRILRIRGTAVCDGEGRATRIAGTIQDVTDEAEARRERDLLSYVVECTDDAILTKSADGTITSWNRGAERLYGYSASEAIGQSVMIIVPPSRGEEVRDILRTAFSGESVDHLETERIRKDGTILMVSLTISPVRDSTGRIVSAGVIARDITDRIHYEQRLRHLADHDQLTGLLNRRSFEQALKRDLARAGRYGSHGAVLSIDIDNFKSINDSAGHAAGDAVLTEVACVLRERFRATDVLARLGGDEFAVLLPSVSPGDARAAAEDLVAALRGHPAVYGDKPFRITGSVGVAPFDSDDATSSELLVNADLAMYAAKTGGRDRVVLYTSGEARSARAMAKLTWSQRIQDALERDRFVLHLQPILELASGNVSHGELLLRMRGNRGKLIAPGAFLPAAERFGLIHAIDRWVVQQAIQLIAGAEGGRFRGLSINLSGESVVGDAGLLQTIEQELANASVDPSQLIFEITETAAIANMAEATKFARGLTSLGCSLALDDFGTGFGSFYYLKHLPVRYVKMDGEFIQNLPRSAVDEHMVRAIVGVAQGLGIKTVAESVADDETIRLLQEHGVDYAQGFHVGKPAPVAAGAR